jgi:hypothetical protein
MPRLSASIRAYINVALTPVSGNSVPKQRW